MKWIVTGAAGFIGCHATHAFCAAGDEVVGLDDLSRPGSKVNLAWLEDACGGRFHFVHGDVREAATVESTLAAHRDAAAVLHLAGQVAVTTSIRDPRSDFEINAEGTFNVCEAARQHLPDAVIVNASTNKVYGSVSDDVELVDGRWWHRTAQRGIDESFPLHFHSPYACSKGAAEQYVLDFARTYGMRTVSVRQSCIYGPRQYGIEDQGWVAWLTAAALAGRPFTIYGDGRQVRDLLYVGDLVELYRACVRHADEIAGLALNAGGGPENALSLLELIEWLEERLGRKLTYAFADERAGDQRFFVADTTRASRLVGWHPQVGVEAGVQRLFEWIEANLEPLLTILSGVRPDRA